MVLTACSSTPEKPDPTLLTLSGTVTAPQGGDVAGTKISACKNGDCTSVLTIIISSRGESAPCSFTDLENTPYQLSAWKDVNGNEQEDPGDYKATLPETVTPTRTNLNLVLSIIPAPDDPKTASISGTLSPPGLPASGEALESPMLLGHDHLRADETAQVIPNELIVKFKPGLRMANLYALNVSGKRLNHLRSTPLPNSEVFSVSASSETELATLIADLKKRPDVVDAHPNWRLSRHLAKLREVAFYKGW